MKDIKHRKTFMCDHKTWNDGKAKANSDGRSFGWVLRQLIRKWVNGEIKL